MSNSLTTYGLIGCNGLWSMVKINYSGRKEKIYIYKLLLKKCSSRKIASMGGAIASPWGSFESPDLANIYMYIYIYIYYIIFLTLK